MNCEQCRDILSELLEGELAPSAEAEARAHLAECPHCARALAELRALVSALRGLPEVEPPAELRARLRRIPDEAPRQDAWRRARFIASSLAAAAAAVLIVWTGLTHYQGRSGVDLVTPPPVMQAAPSPRRAADAEDEARVESVVETPPLESAAEKEAVAVVAPTPGDATEAVRRPRAVRERTETTEARTERMPVSTETTERAAEPPSSVPAEGTGTDVTKAASEIRAGMAPEAGLMAMEFARTPAPAVGGPAGPEVRSPTRMAPAADALMAGAAPGTLPVPEPLYLDARGSEPAIATDTGEGSPFVIAIMPPRRRVVDEIVAATITLETEQAVERARLNVSASPQLELVDVKPDGELFEGPLRAGQETVLSLHMRAREPGAQSIDLRLRSTDPVVDTRLVVGMGDFVEPVPPARRPVQFSFTDKPLPEAAAELSRQSGLSIEVAPECAGRAVTVSAPDPVPAEVAVRSVAAAAGCSVRERDDGMIIEPAQE